MFSNTKIKGLKHFQISQSLEALPPHQPCASSLTDKTVINTGGREVHESQIIYDQADLDDPQIQSIFLNTNQNLSMFEPQKKRFLTNKFGNIEFESKYDSSKLAVVEKMNKLSMRQ